ncbi:hypothetical protein KP509_25G013800 [Ceratopteris richardii]|uniref:Pentatricopeptide repeat-containing protein n=1 Tax=Ceratopteris richardii TaxID=49495 RepID=A0A8T2RMZ6_CERRI|nr:hypothetical protein KP509_25G013800 [Ceratopteris richardii]
MQRNLREVHPGGFEFVAALKVCTKQKNLDGGFALHCHIAQSGLLETNLHVNCTLLAMYAKCGSLTRAEQVFRKLPRQDVVSWTALISAYADQDKFEHVLKCFDEMQNDGISPNAVTFACILSACNSIDKGQEMHGEVERQGLIAADVVVGNSLVHMYTKLGLLAAAEEVFKRLPMQSIVAWTSLIAGYAHHGDHNKAIECFQEMQVKGIIPNGVTYACCLKACGLKEDIDRGWKIHSELDRRGLLESDPVLAGALLDMYVRCGLPEIAREVFYKLPFKSLVTWNTILSGFTRCSDSSEMSRCFDQLQLEGICPDIVTFLTCLSTCRSPEFIFKGKELHVKLALVGLLEGDLAVGNALVDMYAKCGSLGMAQKVFNNLNTRDAVAWTALMSGFCEFDCYEKALECLEQMKFEGVIPDAVTLSCSLQACCSIGDMNKGREIHYDIIEQGLLKDTIIGNILLSMYIKSGFLQTGKQVFDELIVRDSVSWNTMLSGYAEHGLDEAFKWLERVQLEGLFPNSPMFVLALKACTTVGALNKGEELHREIETLGLLGKDLVLSNTLLNMYATNGLIGQAEEVFDRLSVRDVISWTTLMMGYSQLGESSKVFLTFRRMLVEGIKPDSVAFIMVLTVCARVGALKSTQTFLDMMSRDYGVVPHIKHHGCIVSILGCVGHLETAETMLQIAPFANVTMWDTFLGACRNWGSLRFGQKSSLFSAFKGDTDSIKDSP